MIIGIIRFLGFWLLAAAVVVIVIDGTKTIAAQGLVITPFAQTWLQLHTGSLSALQAWMERSLNPLVWNPGVTTLLRLPSIVVFSLLALVFLWIGRPRRNILD